MKCERCGRPATTHIHTVINGLVVEKHLCGYCESMIQLNNFGNLGVMNLLASVFSDESLNAKNDITEKRCRGCGSLYSDIASKGLLGCDKCYETFYKQLFPTLKRIHGNTRHFGKIPLNASPRLASVPDASVLKINLKKAVEEENYELAAKLRDQIRALEGKNND